MCHCCEGQSSPAVVGKRGEIDSTQGEKVYLSSGSSMDYLISVEEDNASESVTQIKQRQLVFLYVYFY